MKLIRFASIFVAISSLLCLANPDPVINAPNVIDAEKYYGHLRLISEAIDAGAFDEYIGEWGQQFPPNEIVCVDQNCEIDGYDYAKMAIQCAAYGGLGYLSFDKGLSGQLSGPFLGKFLRNRLILLSIGLGPHTALVLAAGTFAVGCGTAIWETKNTINKQIKQCKKDLQDAKDSRQTSEYIQEILRKVERLESFSMGLERGSR